MVIYNYIIEIVDFIVGVCCCFLVRILQNQSWPWTTDLLPPLPLPEL